MPPNRKKGKNKHTKSKTGNTGKARRAAPAGKATQPSHPKRSKKKQARKKAAKARPHRSQRSLGKGAQFFSARGRPDTVSGRQSGDLQGVSRAEQADSESVDELVSQGNLFEAGAVAGVEEADNADEKEVHTHEVPEDDVPKEYLDDD